MMPTTGPASRPANANTASVIELESANRPVVFADRFVGRTFLGKYKTRKFIGEGSNAHVFQATSSTDPSQRLVVKRIKEEAAAAPNFRKFFDAEVRSMSRFHHPYSVRLVDASLDDPLGACLVLEYISGYTLEQVIHHERRMPPDRAARILGPLGHVLHSAQRHGIVHRDLKPANLMVLNYQKPNESLKVMDFGFAGFTAMPHIQMSELTGKGVAAAFGTPAYVSPEMIRGDSTDARADIYSVGVILYEMLTGRLPFEHADTHRLLNAHKKDNPPSFRSIGVYDVPPEVEKVTMHALSKFPSERPQTMKDMVAMYSRAIGWNVWEQSAPPGYVENEAEAIDAAMTDAVAAPVDSRVDPFILSDRFEACLPEKLAAIKLRAFIDEVKGQVLESEPGLIRVRVEMPSGHREQQPARTGSGVLAFLSGVVRVNAGVQKGHEPIEIELKMKKIDSNKVAVLVAFRPIRPFLPTDPELWGDRCEAYYSVLRNFVMPE